MTYMRRLFEARPFWNLIRDQSIVLNASESEARSAKLKDGSSIIVYLPKGGSLQINASGLSASKVTAYWFNPRQDSAQLLGTLNKTNKMEFNAPSAGRNNDWVLVLDNVSVGLPQLGANLQNFVPTAH